MTSHSVSESTAWLSGMWHLVALDSGQVPAHSVDFHFFDTAAGFSGTLVPKIGSGPEIPLQQIAFDGATLTLRLNPMPPAQTSMPTLVMTRVDDEFEGGWSKEGQTIGIALRLIRASR